MLAYSFLRCNLIRSNWNTTDGISAQSRSNKGANKSPRILNKYCAFCAFEDVRDNQNWDCVRIYQRDCNVRIFIDACWGRNSIHFEVRTESSCCCYDDLTADSRDSFLMTFE